MAGSTRSAGVLVGMRAPLATLMATVLALVGLAANPAPALASWERVLSISFYNGSNYGDGKGRITSDDGAIDCSWDAGTSGDCSEHYVLPNFQTTYDITLTFTPTFGSYSCLSSQSACQTNGGAQTLSVGFALSTPGDVSLTPSFNLRTFQVQVSVYGPGSVSGDGVDCPISGSVEYCGAYKYGQTAHLTATPDSGVKFNQWNGLCQGTNPSCSFKVANSASVSATFGYWRITFASSAGGSVCGGSSANGCATEGLNLSLLLPPGSSVSMYAYPNPGYRFDYWSDGPCAGEGVVCPVTVSADVTIKGFFTTIVTTTPPPTPRITPRPTLPPTPKPTAKPSIAPTARPSTPPTAPPASSASTPPGASTAPFVSDAPASTSQPGPSTAPSTVAGTGVVPTGTSRPVSSPAGTGDERATGAPNAPVVNPGAAASGPDPWLIVLVILVLATAFLAAFVAGRRRAPATPPRA